MLEKHDRKDPENGPGLCEGFADQIISLRARTRTRPGAGTDKVASIVAEIENLTSLELAELAPALSTPRADTWPKPLPLVSQDAAELGWTMPYIAPAARDATTYGAAQATRYGIDAPRCTHHYHLR